MFIVICIVLFLLLVAIFELFIDAPAQVARTYDMTTKEWRTMLTRLFVIQGCLNRLSKSSSDEHAEIVFDKFVKEYRLVYETDIEVLKKYVRHKPIDEHTFNTLCNVLQRLHHAEAIEYTPPQHDSSALSP